MCSCSLYVSAKSEVNDVSPGPRRRKENSRLCFTYYGVHVRRKIRNWGTGLSSGDLRTRSGSVVCLFTVRRKHLSPVFFLFVKKESEVCPTLKIKQPVLLVLHSLSSRGRVGCSYRTVTEISVLPIPTSDRPTTKIDTGDTDGPVLWSYLSPHLRYLYYDHERTRT